MFYLTSKLASWQQTSIIHTKYYLQKILSMCTKLNNCCSLPDILHNFFLLSIFVVVPFFSFHMNAICCPFADRLTSELCSALNFQESISVTWQVWNFFPCAPFFYFSLRLSIQWHAIIFSMRCTCSILLESSKNILEARYFITPTDSHSLTHSLIPHTLDIF